MALKEDYLDDILDTSVNEKRKYRIINNADGTISLEDVTEYSQNGDNFGSFDINITNKTVNELIAMGLNVRCNADGYLEVFLDGVWKDSQVDTGVKLLNIYNYGEELVSLDYTNYTMQGYQTIEPNVLSNAFEIPVYSDNKAIIIGTDDTIDLTKYSKFNVVLTINSLDYILSLDITSVTGEYYVSVLSFPSGDIGNYTKSVRLIASNNKNMSNDVMIAYKNEVYSYDIIYIKRIWLE